MSGRVAVGVGNPTMGDDGVGRAVVRALEDVTAVDTSFAGTTAMMALEAMAGADRAVVVDAVDTGGRPGTVHRLRVDEGGSGAQVPMHDFTFAEAVRAVQGIYDLPDRIAVVGIVPEHVAPGIGLSDTVEHAVPVAAAMARAELRANGGEDDTTMKATWYCVDCGTEIDPEAVDEHETEGHRVRGRFRPERLLSQDPWRGGDDTSPANGDSAVSRRSNGRFERGGID
jgi:hydrogenase maturation protease